MFKKFACVAAAMAGFMMIGSPAFADDPDDTVGLVNTGDILSDNAIDVCTNSVQVLGVQVVDVLNGLSASVPILTSAPDDNNGHESCIID
ncbi:hypothetical protein L3Q67_45455 (plasmid) [Saccharothrix sp. AJ9571]|nr:hypothetical protein L3Q67_45455 [Saccharothrix sp. AJ9571]